MAEYRVEELAAEAGVSVEALRSYQSKGLVSAPRHEGRVAIYDDGHLARLREIIDLKHQGYSLRMIAHLLGSGTAAAVASASSLGEADEEPLTLRQVAERARVPPAMLRSLQASGVLVPRVTDEGDERRYSSADVRAVRMLLALISSGMPIEEFMAAAHTQIEACERGAQDARDLFLRYGWADGAAEDDPEQVVAALALMLQAVTTLIAYNFQRRVLNAVTLGLVEAGAHTEVDALLREVSRRRLEVLPA